MSVAFEVLGPGLLSTIQDAGRPGAASLGVPRSGACDPWSLAVANLLLGNEPGDAALEVTLVGPELRVLRSGSVALAGADLGAFDVDEERPLAPGGSHRLRAGSTLVFRGPPSGTGGSTGPGTAGAAAGARAYLAVPGGFDVPVVLGSRSTCLVGAFGGLDGRALRPGDRLAAAAVDGRPDEPDAGARWPDSFAAAAPDSPIRVLAGPHAGSLPPAARDGLVEAPWHVAPASDRMGLRLDGEPLADAAAGGSIVSIPVTWGAVQLPPGGRPIVLLADHQTVGGYPVIACVIGADLPRLGQLQPGAAVRFAWTDLATARAARRDQAAALAAGAAILRRGDPWDRLVEAAG